MSNSRASAASSRAGSKASASAARAMRSSASLASITARSSAASASASKRMVGGAALDPPRRQAQLASAPSEPPSNSSSPVRRFAGLGPGLHRRPLLGQARLLARLGLERRDLGRGMVEPVAVALGALGQRRAPRPAPRSSRSTSAQAASTGDAVDPAESVEQGAVAARVEQAAIVMLAVDLDGQAGRRRAAARRARWRRRRRRGCRRRP